MNNKFLVIFLTFIFYLCVRNNNRRSGRKIKVPRIFIKLVFPLLEKNINSKVDIVSFLEALYLIMACMIYYITIAFGLMPVEKMTTIWGAMFFGIVSLLGGIDLFRRSFDYNIVIIIIMCILGIGFIVLGIFLVLLTILGVLFQLF